MRTLLVLLVACASTPPPHPVELEPTHCGPPPVQAAPAPAGEAHLVEKTGTTGVVSLSGDHAVAVERAYALMAQHCGEGKWKVLGDDWVPMTDVFAPAVLDMSVDFTERRVRYECAASQ
jgi:hypothetical protein